MNRLIDANKLEETILVAKEQHGQVAESFTNMGGELSTEWWCVEDMVENAETVKAIPEEWINDHVAWLESMDADVAWSDARAIKAMLAKWKMEQENTGGCSADACPIKF